MEDQESKVAELSRVAALGFNITYKGIDIWYRITLMTNRSDFQAVYNHYTWQYIFNIQNGINGKKISSAGKQSPVINVFTLPIFMPLAKVIDEYSYLLPLNPTQNPSSWSSSSSSSVIIKGRVFENGGYLVTHCWTREEHQITTQSILPHLIHALLNEAMFLLRYILTTTYTLALNKMMCQMKS